MDSKNQKKPDDNYCVDCNHGCHCNSNETCGQGQCKCDKCVCKNMYKSQPSVDSWGTPTISME